MMAAGRVRRAVAAVWRGGVKKKILTILVALCAAAVIALIAHRVMSIGKSRWEDVARIEMVHVEGGTFLMGCTEEQGDDCFKNEKPPVSMTVRDYQIGKYPVTQGQWKAVMGGNPSFFNTQNLLKALCDNVYRDVYPPMRGLWNFLRWAYPHARGLWKFVMGNNLKWNDRWPVESVCWDDAQVFIERLNAQTGKKYRLPTYAEWEYAARGGNKSKGYKYSGSNDAGKVAWYNSKYKRNYTTHPVGKKMVNELGIYDMSGNVWELAAGSFNFRGRDYGLACGGGWNCNDARSVRIPSVFPVDTDLKNNYIGFRLALDP